MSANNHPTPISVHVNYRLLSPRRGYHATLASFLILLTGILLIMSGCSENGNSLTTSTQQLGRLEFAFKWPQSSNAEKFIPKLTQSLVFTAVNSANTYNQTKTINRDSDDVQVVESFGNIPLGQLTVTVIAYPGMDGQGVPLATNTATVTITATGTTRCTLDPQTTIKNLEIGQLETPDHLYAGMTVHLFATAKDADRNVVLLPANGIYWKSSDSTVATVDHNGLVTAAGSGAVTITAIERETGVTSDGLTLNVSSSEGGLVVTVVDEDIAVSLNTSSRVLTPVHNTYDFTAIVSGSPNKLVEWSADAGNITQTGHYIAPTTPGTYHVTATSIANPAKSAIATVTVANVEVNPDTTSIILTPGDAHLFTATVSEVPTQDIIWTVEEPGGGSINRTTGFYTAPSSPGTYHIIATSVGCPTEEARITVTVLEISITLDTATLVLQLGGKHTFSADITGIDDKRISWLIQENNGGTITQSGAYTAPTTPGTYHVIAFCTACPTEKATATITVAY